MQTLRKYIICDIVNVSEWTKLYLISLRIACYERGIEIMFCYHYHDTSGSLRIAMKCFSALTLVDEAITLSLRPRPPVTRLTDPPGLWICTALYLDDRKASPDHTMVPFLDFLDFIPNHQISTLHYVHKPIKPTRLLVIHLYVKR